MNQEIWDKYNKSDEREDEEVSFNIKERIDVINTLQKITDNTDLFVGKKVLDIGCEDGSFAEYLKATYNSCVTGITLGKIPERNICNVHIVKGDMHNIPFNDDEFNVVTIMHTVEHSIAPYIVLSEIKRVLKPNGIAIIIMPEEGDLWTGVPKHYSVLTFRQLFNLLYKLKFVPEINMRHEYTQSQVSIKRDIVAMWCNTDEVEDKLNEKPFLIAANKGISICQDTNTYTFVIPHKLEHTIMDKDHMLCRTDSLKGG